MIRAVLIDYGGVLAEEGFREGLKAIARKNRVDPDVFFADAERLIHETGYLTGRAGESEYWTAVRKSTGIKGTDQELRSEILSRFVLRPDVIACVDDLKSRGLVTALLSDQTNWLDELNARTPFFGYFDRIFNSYHIHKSKRDASLFEEICRELDCAPGEALFIDDNRDHISRAAGVGLRTVQFHSVEDCERAKALLVRRA